MQADLPHTLYLDKDTRKKSKGGGSRTPKNTKASDEVIRLQEEANRRMRERKARQQEAEPEVTLEELFTK